MVTKSKTGQVILNIVFILLTIAALAPFLLLISSSLSSEAALAKSGYGFWPKEFSFNAYTYLFKSSAKIIKGYGITILVTVMGTFVSVLTTTLFAYPLSRKELPFRYGFSFFVFFTMLFNGGLVRYLYDVDADLSYKKYFVGIDSSGTFDECFLCNYDALIFYV